MSGPNAWIIPRRFLEALDQKRIPARNGVMAESPVGGVHPAHDPGHGRHSGWENVLDGLRHYQLPNVGHQPALPHFVDSGFDRILVEHVVPTKQSRSGLLRRRRHLEIAQQRNQAARWDREIVILQLDHIGNGKSPPRAQELGHALRTIRVGPHVMQSIFIWPAARDLVIVRGVVEPFFGVELRAADP